MFYRLQYHDSQYDLISSKTMDYFKAVISSSGDESLYQALSGEVERRLPTASVSWKRSFGRPSKEVVLQANFVRFDPSKFPCVVDSVSSLTLQPLLHVFWTSCLDNDKYKSAVKTQIMRWQKVLIENQIVDWLIVHVLYQDNSKANKSKINLPRSSVYDKIRTDFGQKFSDRCIQLWEPDKETLFTKSGESWDALLLQLRHLLLDSFGRNLDSFEDRIRVNREKYADPQWPFIDYFIIHEELALIYQSITLREDALVQYDEVDALLSQFIINCSGRELPKWLEKFTISPSNWDGVSLRNQNLESYKILIKSGNASLIDFRNYLFSRQCKLLINMNRKQTIPSRMMEFVYMVVQELKLLNVDVKLGQVACWTVLTCMQLFQILETVEDKDYEYRSTYAHMYNYMREKFHYLGQITGLYYNREPTYDEKKLSELLISGFGKNPSRKNEMPSSIKLLNAALSSKDAYESLYLEFSEKTIKLMSDLRRLHFSMYVGIDLAKYHVQYERFDIAEVLLDKAWSIYKQQKWESLYTDVLIPLADCQLKHNLKTRYISSIAMLSCAKCLPEDTQKYYTDELLKLSKDVSIESRVIGIDPVLKIVDIHINLVKNKGHIGDMIHITVDVINELNIDLECKSISIVLKHGDLNNPKSFSDGSPSARSVSNFDLLTSDVYVSLNSEEKQLKEIPKEPITPSSLLKKFKGHKRTWSRNKNVLENLKAESPSSSSSEHGRSSSISYTQPDGSNNSSARKALFAADDKPNSHGEFPQNHVTRTSSLQDIDFKSSVGDLRSSCIDLRSSYSDVKSNSVDIPALSSEMKKSSDSRASIGAALGKPLATSSVTQFESEPNCGNGSTTSISSSTGEDIFLEPELEENLDQLLVSSSNFILSSGRNNVLLKSRINAEGRFVLQSMTCVVGNLKFYKLLTQLSRETKSFFMVADPPKIVWTTDHLHDYLFTGCKQRLYVTLLNGPGMINYGSLIHITSPTNIVFHDLQTTKIQIYPLERDGTPRYEFISGIVKANTDSTSFLLHLPECKPYERVNLCFDVEVPKKMCYDWMMQYEIQFNCLWLKGLVDSTLQLDCLFYEPFQTDYECFQKGGNMLVKLALRGINPVMLKLFSPLLSSVVDNVTFTLLSESDVHLHGAEQCSFLWKVKCSELDQESDKFFCQFEVNFINEDNNSNNVGCFYKPMNLSYTNCLYTVCVLIPNTCLKKSEPCYVTVLVNRIFVGTVSYRLFLILNTENGTWKYNSSNEYNEVIFNENSNETSISVSMSCELNDGSVAAPIFLLAKLSNNIKNSDSKDILDGVTSFNYGQVDYEHTAMVIFYNDNDDSVL